MEEKTLYPSKKQQILLLVISLVFVAGGVLLIYRGEWEGYLCTVFFGLGVLIFIIQLLPGASYLKLSEEGFEYSSMFKSFSVKWKDIKEFRIMTQKQSGLTVNKMVGWNYLRTENNQSIGQKISEKVAGIEAGLPDTYGLKAEELLELLEIYWKKKTVQEYEANSETHFARPD